MGVTTNFLIILCCLEGTGFVSVVRTEPNPKTTGVTEAGNRRIPKLGASQGYITRPQSPKETKQTKNKHSTVLIVKKNKVG